MGSLGVMVAVHFGAVELPKSLARWFVVKMLNMKDRAAIPSQLKYVL